MLLAAAGLGLLTGLVIGALGGGGSILTVPALVYALGLSAQEATTASLVIVGLTAAVAAIGHARSGHTRWRSGLLLAAVGVPTSLLGTHLNRLVDENALLLAFAALMLVAAAGMLIRSGDDDGADPQGRDVDPDIDSTPSRGAGKWARLRGSARTTLPTVAAGLGIGALTGFFGVGGGFVIVPVLVVLLHVPMTAAVGTSLLVIAVNSAVALAARTGQGSFDWQVIVPFTAAAVIASLAGQRVVDRLPGRSLTRAFAALLVLVAGYVGVRASLALT